MAAEQGSARRHDYEGFDLLRILAAVAVVFGHSFDLTGNSAAKPTYHVRSQLLGPGTTGVYVFFAISGFLVFASWERSGRTTTFVRNRIVRIWPALTLVSLFSAFVLGPVASTLPLIDYFSDQQVYTYAGRNLTLVAGTEHQLPGVFGGEAVNGSIWTLPYEVWCYIGLLLLGVLGVTRRSAVVLGVTGLCLLLYRLGAHGEVIPLPYAFGGVSMRGLVEFGSFFLVGASLAKVRQHVRLPLLAPAGGTALIAAFVLSEPVLYAVGLTLAVIGIGSLRGTVLRAFGRGGDPSYGIYIYSFPIQQTLFHTGIATTTLTMLALSGILSISAGYLSWHLLEYPAMQRFKARSQAPVQKRAHGPTAAV